MTESIYQQFSETELRILKARADRVARQVQGQEQVELQTVLSIKVGAERYALPIESVSSVYEDISIVPVPCVPDGVAGIANIRGRIILALDLKTLLNITAENSDTALVMLAESDLDVALLVSGISGVETLLTSTISPVPANGDVQKAAHIAGLFADGLALLDMASLVKRFSSD
ncbi:MAG TPA: chemotaxis protein CheW [Aggregatilineales bacterium]|nr:chemotaxis protein CheW [Aggregatilineales bacterium]